MQSGRNNCAAAPLTFEKFFPEFSHPAQVKYRQQSNRLYVPIYIRHRQVSSGIYTHNTTRFAGISAAREIARVRRKREKSTCCRGNRILTLAMLSIRYREREGEREAGKPGAAFLSEMPSEEGGGGGGGQVPSGPASLSLLARSIHRIAAHAHV